MAKRYALEYRDFTIPVDKLVSSYDRLFKDNKDIYSKNGKNFSTQIDEFVDSLSEGYNELSIWKELNKHLTEYGYMKECTILKEKYDAARIIWNLYNLKRKQIDIDKKARELSPVYGLTYASQTFGSNQYSRVPEDLMIQFRNQLSWTKQRLETIKEKNYSSDFMDNFYWPSYEALKWYYQIFDLNQTPIKEKVKDAAFEGIMRIVCFIIFCLLFWLIAYIFTHQ